MHKYPRLKSWVSMHLEFQFLCPCWYCYVEVLCELPLWPCKCSNKLYFLPEWLMPGVVDSWLNCGSQLFLFLTVILFRSCGNLSRPKEHTAMLNPPPSSNLLRSYLMSLLIFRFRHNLLKANIFFQSLIKQSCISCILSFECPATFQQDSTKERPWLFIVPIQETL